jgi:hypothetical protein
MWLALGLCTLAFAAGAALERLKRRHLQREIHRLNRLLDLVRAALDRSERTR